MTLEQTDKIIFDLMLNPYFIAFYLFVIIASAAIIALSLIRYSDKRQQKTVDQIGKEYSARAKAQLEEHRAFMALHKAPTPYTDKY